MDPREVSLRPVALPALLLGLAVGGGMLAACGRRGPAREAEVARAVQREVRKQAARAQESTLSVKATRGSFSVEDARGRRLLEARVKQVNGQLAPGLGLRGPVRMQEARCRLYRDGKPQMDLEAPTATWDGKALRAEETARAVTADGRTVIEARRAVWTAAGGELELGAARLQRRLGGRTEFTVETPRARVVDGVVTMPEGATGWNEAGQRLSARSVRWRLATGRLEASGDVELTDRGARVTGQRLVSDTRLRRGRLWGRARIAMERNYLAGAVHTPGRRRNAMSSRSPEPRRRLSVPLAAALAAVAVAGPTGRAAPVAAPAAGKVQKKVLGTIEVAAEAFEFEVDDNENTTVRATGRVVLTTPDSRLTAPRMTVDLTPAKELRSARCEGGVEIARRDADGTLTARGDTLDYSETEGKAALRGDVEVRQPSPRLLAPALITGERIDIDLKERRHTVLGGGGRRARVHVEPKGRSDPETRGEEPPRSRPEPLDLTADRIEVRAATQDYVATGRPVLARPSSTLTAEVIRFRVEESLNDVRAAEAEGNVRFEGRNEKGRHVRVSGDRATYDRESGRLTVTGRVRAEMRNAPDAEPFTSEGSEFTWDLRTGRYTLKGGGGPARISVPKAEVDAAREKRPAPEPPAGEKKP